jgi:hypothetical protein
MDGMMKGRMVLYTVVLLITFRALDRVIYHDSGV